MNMNANKKTTIRSVVRPLITAMSKRLATRWSAVSLAMMASLGFHDDEPETEPRPSVPINENDEAGAASDAAANVVDAETSLDFAALTAIMPAPSATLTRAWTMRPPSSTLSSGRRLHTIDETASMAVDDVEDTRILERCVTQRVHFGVECFDIDDEEDDDEPEANDEQKQEADAVDEEDEHTQAKAEADAHEIRAAAHDASAALAAPEDGTTLALLRSDVAQEDNHVPIAPASVTTDASDLAPLVRYEQDDATEDAIDGFELVLPSDDDIAFPVELLHDDKHAGEDAMAAVAVDDDDDAGASRSTSRPFRPLIQPSGSSSSRSTASLSSSGSPTSPSLSSVSPETRRTRTPKVSPYAHVTAKVQSHNHTSVPPPPRDYAAKEVAAKKLLHLQNRELRQRLVTVGPRVGSFNHSPPARKPTRTEFEQTLAFEELEIRLENHVMRRRLSQVTAMVRTQPAVCETSQSASASPSPTVRSTPSLQDPAIKAANAAQRERLRCVRPVTNSHNATITR